MTMSNTSLILCMFAQFCTQQKAKLKTWNLEEELIRKQILGIRLVAKNPPIEVSKIRLSIKEPKRYVARTISADSSHFCLS